MTAWRFDIAGEPFCGSEDSDDRSSWSLAMPDGKYLKVDPGANVCLCLEDDG